MKIKKVVTDKGYLIGVKDNEYIYLEKPSWNCYWYWAFGYLEYYYKNLKNDHRKHTHFDIVFLETQIGSGYDIFKKLDRCVLNDKEIWLLLDYMSTFYKLREAAEVFTRGDSNYTACASQDFIKNIDIRDNINKVILQRLFGEIHNLLTKE